MKALGNWVVLKKLKQEKKNVNGFVVETSPERKGEVISAGESDLKKKQVVVYTEHKELEDNLVAVKQEDIIAIYE